MSGFLQCTSKETSTILNASYVHFSASSTANVHSSMSKKTYTIPYNINNEIPYNRIREVQCLALHIQKDLTQYTVLASKSDMNYINFITVYCNMSTTNAKLSKSRSYSTLEKKHMNHKSGNRKILQIL